MNSEMKPLVLASLVLMVASLFLAACRADRPPAGSSTGSGFTIGGTVSGLSGSGLVLQDNGTNNLAISANGAFTFTTDVASGGAYAVTVLTQPSDPTQACAVTNGTGSASANVTSVEVACSSAYTIGGTVSGLTGSGLVLQDNGGDNLTIKANGAFTFTTTVASAGQYAVTVLTQPSNPNQTCTVANGSGTANANVTNVNVSCGVGTFSIGGQVAGLSGSGLVLQDNGGDNLNVSKGGTFTFATGLSKGATYSVTVFTQPTNPSQDCTVANGSGTVTTNVGNIVITCSAGTLSVGGSVSGLAGSGLVLQNDGGDNLTIKGNGAFTFDTLVSSGSNYNVTVATQPTDPSQTCTVTNGSGTATGNISSVQVVCPAVFFSIGGQVVGLLPGSTGVELQDNTGDNLPITGNGTFTFTDQIAYNSAYDVSLFVGPTPAQGAVLWNYQGTATANVTSVVVDFGHNDWTWMNGANTANQAGSSTPPCPLSPPTSQNTSAPGSRQYPGTWTDNNGNLWLFGGYGYYYDTSIVPHPPVFLNDMWEYVGTNSYFAGYDSCWALVQSAGSGVGPTPRWDPVTWTDAGGNLWLFGGQDAATNFLSDLWEYSISSNTWTEVAASAPNSTGLYNSPGAFPGSRWGATARYDSSTKLLWLFGGEGYDSNGTLGLLSDLWTYNGSGNTWTFVSGSKLANQAGVYNNPGSNAPGGRQESVSWLDSSGNFWLFGGFDLDSTGQPAALNDLWEYSAGVWTWVSGADTQNQTAVYGTLGTAASGNVPGARWGAAAWTDLSGRLWLFGGQGYDSTGNGSLADLWEFNPTSKLWTWVKGPNSVDQAGLYGIAANPTVWPYVIDFPGSRYGAGYWTLTFTNQLPAGDNGVEFWIFGGQGYDSTGSNPNGYLNDLWRYLPYP